MRVDPAVSLRHIRFRRMVDPIDGPCGQHAQRTGSSRSITRGIIGSSGMLESLAAIAVAQHVVAGRCDGRADGRIALQGDGAGEEGAADAVLLEDAQEAPHAGAAAVLEE